MMIIDKDMARLTQGTIKTFQQQNVFRADVRNKRTRSAYTMLQPLTQCHAWSAEPEVSSNVQSVKQRYLDYQQQQFNFVKKVTDDNRLIQPKSDS